MSFVPTMSFIPSAAPSGSAVPPRGILRKLYRDATETTMEHAPSAFWQVFLQRHFRFEEGYIVVGESPPERGASLRRVDIFVKRYDHENDTLSAIILVECKGSEGNLRSVEDQAADALKRCLDSHQFDVVYAMTTIGVQFRVWKMEAGGNSGEQLLPLFGGQGDRGDRKAYIDADSAQGFILLQAIHEVKNRAPLRVAPMVPSQAPGPSMWGQPNREGGGGGSQSAGHWEQAGAEDEGDVAAGRAAFHDN